MQTFAQKTKQSLISFFSPNSVGKLTFLRADNASSFHDNRSRLLLLTLLAWQTAFGTVIYALSQGRYGLALISTVIVVTAYILTDRFGWIKLHWTFANVAALIAVGVTVRSYRNIEPETQLLAIADLLLYLQFILLFQEKFPRLMWQILVMSFLQVLLGAALSTKLFYGVVLVPYFICELWLLILLAQDRHSRAHRRWQSHEHQWDNAVAPVQQQASGNKAGANKSAYRPMWRPGDLRLISAVVAFSLVTTIVIFISIPRFRRDSWSVSSLSTTSTVGFNSTISLGGMGTIVENDEPVMRVQFLKPDKSFYRIAGEPLFRGSILNQYKQGDWKFIGRSTENVQTTLGIAPKNYPDKVLQHTIIQGSKEEIVFNIYPVFWPIGSEENLSGQNMHRFPIGYHEKMQYLLRTGNTRDRQLEYTVVTTGLYKGRQHPIYPAESMNERAWQQLLQLPSHQPIETLSPNTYSKPQRLTEVGDLDDLSELDRISKEVFAADKLKPNDKNLRYLKCKSLERYLRSSRFKYSLKRTPRPDNVDPIVDYVRDNPSGHCEFSASALALMLRTQGIPARVVVGYKGGDYNQVGSFYQINQVHAHAWVEAYLDDEQVPEDFRIDGQYSRIDGWWLILDPTPMAEVATFAEEGVLASLSDMGAYIQMLWSNYVVGLNAERQQQSIYEPLQEISNSAQGWFSGEDDSSEANAGINYGLLFSKVLRIGGAVLLVGAVFFYIRSWRRKHRLASQAPATNTRSASRAYSDRHYLGTRWWTALVAQGQKVGLFPKKGETPLDFALQVRHFLAGNLQTVSVAHLPVRIVEAYYRDRFGSRALDTQEVQTVEQGLHELSHNINLTITAPPASAHPL